MLKLPNNKLRWDNLFDLFLLLLILVGVGFRFTGVAWNQGTNLHPDEYGMTNTLTQLKLPANLGDYFNTRLSSISPYARYDLAGQYIGDGPDNRMRWGQWPLILLRASAELFGQTGYDELRLMGRQLSALLDTLCLVFIFLIGRRLYGYRAGLLAAALSALAVLQIQQSHFMTVDTFAVGFTLVAMYCAVRIAQQAPATRTDGENPIYQPVWKALGWYVGFGVAFGMAVASKVNLAPLAGMIVIAAGIAVADLKLRTQADLTRIFGITAAFLVTAGLISLLTFRLTQPMSFRAESGETSLLTIHLNPDWLESMKVAQSESDGVGGGPPGEQWASRPAIVFPLVNMVLWGMGLPLGLAAWGGVLAAGWQWLRYGKNWRAHLLPLVWVGGYFLFMGTRWVKSVRYFLPIYAFLCLFAAWGLLALWNWSRQKLNARILSALSGGLIALVLLGTLGWAAAFVNAVYRTDHTRIQATRWIFENIPGPFHLTLRLADGREQGEPLGAPANLRVTSSLPYLQSFQVSTSGSATQITLPHAAVYGRPGRLHLALQGGSGPRERVLAEVDLDIPAVSASQPGGTLQAAFPAVMLEQGQTYFLVASVPQGQPDVWIARNVIANESWDEGLPVPFDGRDPFGQLYNGLTMEVRWMDNEDKRSMFLERLAEADYLLLPSQRAVWASCRLPRMYPMTMTYYRALFSGQLGFERIATFSAPLQVGPLYVSDLAGTAAWGQAPDLPVFNHNPLAAEEAFSVYDHPPVWVFRKRADFNLENARRILFAVDLNQVLIQSPREVTDPPCPE